MLEQQFKMSVSTKNNSRNAANEKQSTKDRIVQAGIKLFNLQGYVNVTIRDIAEEVGISSGNLAYHYKNKDAVLAAAYEGMTGELARMVTGVQLIPSFDNIDRQIKPFVEFQKAYRFFWQDTVEICRAMPSIADTLQAQTSNQIASIRAMLDYSVGSGNMVSEPNPGSYDHLARTTWTLVAFWLPASFLQEDPPKGPEPAIWNMILPLLTQKGHKNFAPVGLRHGLIDNSSTN